MRKHRRTRRGNDVFRDINGPTATFVTTINKPQQGWKTVTTFEEKMDDIINSVEDTISSKDGCLEGMKVAIISGILSLIGMGLAMYSLMEDDE